MPNDINENIDFPADFEIPSAYDLNEFAEIHICDESGQVLYKTCSKEFAGQWLIDNGYIKVSDIGDYFDPEQGTICFFNAMKIA